jgi:predicted N-acyltransferase
MIDLLLDEIPRFSKFSKSFIYEYSNVLPFHWRGFRSAVNYTYVIEGVAIDELDSGLKNDVRRRRRKAEELGVTVCESHDIAKLYELNENTFLRKKKSIPYDFEFIKNLYIQCKKHEACKILIARDSDGEIVAGSLLIYDDSTVYYLLGGIDTGKRDLGGMDLVLLDSIRFSIESGRKFDFEGSMVESIERYFRSFGAIQKPYYRVHLTGSKLLKMRDLFKGVG